MGGQIESRGSRSCPEVEGEDESAHLKLRDFRDVGKIIQELLRGERRLGPKPEFKVLLQTSNGRGGWTYVWGDRTGAIRVDPPPRPVLPFR